MARLGGAFEVVLMLLMAGAAGAADEKFILAHEFIPVVQNPETGVGAPSDVRRMVVQRCAQPPLIDGRLDEACWRSARFEGGFVVLRDSVRKRANQILPGMPEHEWAQSLGYATNVQRQFLAREQTEAAICYDHENLYVAFRCVESQMEKLAASITERDRQVWRDDCVELLLDLNRDGIADYHFLVNPLGTQEDWKGTEKQWNGIWESKAQTEVRSWTAEIRIPFAALDCPAPFSGAAWRVNLGREEARLQEHSSWSEMDKSFHEPERFGLLFFDKVPACSFSDVSAVAVGYGDNVFSCRIKSNSATPCHAKATVQILADGAPPTPRAVETDVPAAGEVSCSLPFKVSASGNVTLVAALRDDQDTALDAYRVTFLVPEKLLELRLPQAEFLRDDAVGVAVVTAHVGSETARKSQLRLSLLDNGGRTRLSGEVGPPASGTVRLKLSIAPLGLGRYKLRAALVGPDGHLIEQAEAPLAKIEGLF